MNATSSVGLTASASLLYASLWRRIGAYAIDLVLAISVLILVAISMRMFRALGVWTPVPTGVDPETTWFTLGVGTNLLVMLGYVVAMGPTYFIFFHSSPWQATFGKRLLNIHVTDDAGQRITIGRAVKRWFTMFFLSWFGGTLVSLITIPTSKKHKALHDMLADTLVLNGRVEQVESLEGWRVFAAFGIPFLWLLTTFMIVF